MSAKELKQQYGVTVKDVHEHLTSCGVHVDYSAVSRWLSGQKPKYAFIQRLIDSYLEKTKKSNIFLIVITLLLQGVHG